MNLINELKAAGILHSDADTATFLDQLRKELTTREIANAYLEDSAEASFNFFHDLVVPPKWQKALAPVHTDVAEFITEDDGKDWKLILIPREHLKSTQITVGEATRLAIRDPNSSTLLCHQKHKKSMSYLVGIKGVLLKPRVQELFGDLLPHSDKYRPDNGEVLTLASRDDLSIREPTFATSGIDKIEQSGHYKRIIDDDLVTEDNAPIGASPEQLEKPILYFKSQLDLLDKADGKLWITGTWHHPLDLYGHVMETACDPACREAKFHHVSNCSCDMSVFIRELQDERGEYIYPARFNDRVAERLLRNKGIYDFARHYRNNPVDPATCWLKTREIELMKCDSSEIAKRNQDGELIIFQLVDPAESKKKKSAFTAIVTVGVHKETGHWYIMGASKARVETREFIDMIFAEHRRFKPYSFAMETNTRKALTFVLETQMQKDHYFFSIEELNPRTNDGPDEKKRRFKQNVVPLVQYGQVHCDRTLKDMIDFLSTCPQARYWDLGDALSYLPEIAPVISKQSEADAYVPEEAVELFEGTGF